MGLEVAVSGTQQNIHLVPTAEEIKHEAKIN